MNEIQIIKAKSEDSAEVFNLIKQLWPNIKFDYRRIQMIYNKKIRSSKYHLFIAKLENKIVAFTSYSIKDDFLSQGPICYLDELIVDKNHKGLGIGSKMIKYIEKREKPNCKLIRLHTAHHRKKTQNFYKSKNFDSTALVFEKKI